MTGAFWYLIRTSARNRFVRQVARLRTPRYALAMVAGLAYFWLVVLRPQATGTVPNSSAWVSGASLWMPLVGLLVVAYTWIAGGNLRALTFAPAEIAMLFPAPVSRRRLLLYKMARSQIPILFSALIWTALLRRQGAPLDAVLRSVALWTAFSTLAIHNLGVALLRADLIAHGRKALQRGLWATGVLVAIVAAVSVGFYRARHEVFDAPSIAIGVANATTVLQVPPAGIALLPFNLLIAPLLASSTGAWLSAIGPALLLLGLHIWWVLGQDAQFEEAAADASAKQAKVLADFRARRTLTPIKPKAVRRTLPLSPMGMPAIALLWKNSVWLLRTGQVNTLVGPAGIAVVAYAIIGRTSTTAATVILIVTVALVVMQLIFGPAIMRNDLRSDLLHLPMLKTFPLSGRDVVMTQVLSGAAPNSLSQYLLLAVSGLAFMAAKAGSALTIPVYVGALVALPTLLLALNGAIFTLHNGVALLFPGWVKLGPQGAQGIEATGQVMLTMAATLLTLVVLLIVPGAVGAGFFLALRPTPAAAIIGGGWALSTLLAGEVYLLMLALGRAFDRIEPQQTA